jgi:hypothetical protein
MPGFDETVAVLRDEQWQYVRIPLSIKLPETAIYLHRDTVDGPITLFEPDSAFARRRKAERIEDIFREVDEALAAGETFQMERTFCPPREFELE